MLAAVHDLDFAPVADEQQAQAEQAEVAEALQAEANGVENTDFVVAVAGLAGVDITGAEAARHQRDAEAELSAEELDRLAGGPAVVRVLSHGHSGSDVDIEDMQPCDNSEGKQKATDGWIKLMGIDQAWDDFTDSVSTALEVVSDLVSGLFDGDDDDDEDDSDSSSTDDNDSDGNDGNSGNSGNGDEGGGPLADW